MPEKSIYADINVHGKIYREEVEGQKIDIDLDLGTYRPVADIAARDAIPAAKRMLGMRVHITGDKTSYVLSGGLENTNWKYLGTDINKEQIPGDTDFWIDGTLGNDDTGDGSQVNPWQTFEGAILNMPSQLNTGDVDLFFAAGSYTVTDVAVEALSQFLIHKNLKIWGVLTLVRDDFTAQTATPDGNPYKRTVVGATFTENQYTGYCGRHDNYDPSFEYAPIGPHGTNEIHSTLQPSGYWIGGIMSYDTTFTFETNKLPDLKGSQWLKFNDCIIAPGQTTKNLSLQIISAAGFQTSNCRIDSPVNKSILIKGNIDFGHTIIMCNMSSDPALTVRKTMGFALTSTILYNTNPAGSVDGAVSFDQIGADIYGAYIYGFAYGYLFDGNVSLHTRYGHYPSVFDNVGCAYYIGRSSAKHVMGEDYGEHKIYLFNTNYLFSMGGGAMEDLIFNFGKTRLINTPAEDWFVPAAGGLWQGNPTALHALVDKPVGGYIDPTRAVVFYIPDLFVEVEPPAILTIPNNTASFLQVGDITKNYSVTIDYYFERGSLEGTGRMTLTKNMGTKLTENSGGGDDHLVFFGKEINGNEIRLTWDDTTEPTGDDTTIKYTITRKII